MKRVRVETSGFCLGCCLALAACGGGSTGDGSAGGTAGDGSDGAESGSGDDGVADSGSGSGGVDDGVDDGSGDGGVIPQCADAQPWVQWWTEGGPFDDRIHGLAPLSGCGVAVGVELSIDLEGPEAVAELRVVRLAADGSTVWSVPVQQSESNGIAVAADADDNIAFAYVTDEVPLLEVAEPAFGGTDLIVGKLDPEGNLSWVHRYGGVFNETLGGIAFDGAGNLIVGGSYDDTIDFGGGALPAAMESDIFLAALDPGGGELWSVAWSGPEHDDIAAVDADAAGRIAVTGRIRGPVEIAGEVLPGSSDYQNGFVARLSGDAQLDWGYAFAEGINGASPRDVALDPDGGVALVGGSPGSLNFGGLGVDGRAFVIAFDAAGSPAWGLGFGDDGGTTGRAVEVDAQGRVWFGLQLGQSVNVDGAMVGADGGLLVAQYDADGTHLFHTAYAPAGVEAIAIDESGHALVGGAFSEEVDFGDGPWDSGSTVFDDGFLLRLAGSR